MIDRISQPKNTLENKIKINKKQSFKGPVSSGLWLLRGINQKPALGACGVDLCSMVIPRTAIEMKNRGKQAGIEAMFREGISCFIHACVGLIGFAAGSLISQNFNKANGIKAQKIFANNKTIMNLSKMWQNTQGQSDKFFVEFLKNIKGLNGTEFKGISENVSAEMADKLVELANKTAVLSKLKGADKKYMAKEVNRLKSVIINNIVKDTGAQTAFNLNAITDASGKVIQKGVSSNLTELIDNAIVLSNAFKTKTLDKIPEFAKKLSHNKNLSTALGLGICAALCMSVQPINRYLTKKRTGHDGFVGVKDKQASNSKSFKTLKTILGVGFPIAAISSIGKLSELPANVQFNSTIPTLNQFKFLYGLTIGSRFLASRDSNELRESVIKDTLGFTNWLILGGVVSKLAARGLGGKEIMNNPVVQDGAKKGIKYAWNWLTKASVKSFDEILLPNAKEIIKDGKAIPFKELYKNAEPEIKSLVRKAGIAQVAGYLYSGLVLGVGIAKLNIFITKSLEKRKHAKQNMNKQINSSNNPAGNYNYKKESSVFSEFLN